MSDALCADIVVLSVDQNQFRLRKTVSLTSASLRSNVEDTSSIRFIKNKNDIPVGEFLGFLTTTVYFRSE